MLTPIMLQIYGKNITMIISGTRGIAIFLRAFESTVRLQVSTHPHHPKGRALKWSKIVPNAFQTLLSRNETCHAKVVTVLIIKLLGFTVNVLASKASWINPANGL